VLFERGLSFRREHSFKLRLPFFLSSHASPMSERVFFELQKKLASKWIKLGSLDKEIKKYNYIK
jgi:hypothetical protein